MLLSHLFLSVFPSFIKKAIYRLLGHEIGKKVKIGLFSVVSVSEKMVLKEGCRIKPFVFIRATHLEIGTYSEICSFTFINTPKVSVGCDTKVSSFIIIRSGHVSKSSELRVGDIVHIFPFVTIDCSRLVQIGNETGVGPQCNIFTHSSYKSILEGYSVVYGDVIIGERVELTYDVFIAPGVTIDDDAICALGSYVNKDVPEGVLVAGLPAKVKRTKEQIIGDVSQINDEKVLKDIIDNYIRDISYLTKKQAVNVVVCSRKDVVINEKGKVYILVDCKINEIKSREYGVFDITNKLCYNNGIDTIAFGVLRKYLSRYGIRFRTKIL